MKVMKQRTFTLKHIALAMMIAAGSMTSAYAVLTGTTGTIQGLAPVLKSPDTSTDHKVDFEATLAEAGKLRTGDTITMKYAYTDTDGDADSSTTTVHWFYVRGGVETEITAGITNALATSTDGTGQGTSAVVIPSTAVGAKIKAVITETSLTGDPTTGEVITYADVSQVDDNKTDVPVDPVEPGDDVVSKIFLSTDATETNLIGSSTKLQVGETYVFKLFAADGTTELTSTVNYNWKLTGTSATTSTAAPATLFNPDANFVVPTNTAGKVISGSDDGVQGFGLAVDYNAKQ